MFVSYEFISFCLRELTMLMFISSCDECYVGDGLWKERRGSIEKRGAACGMAGEEGGLARGGVRKEQEDQEMLRKAPLSSRGCWALKDDSELASQPGGRERTFSGRGLWGLRVCLCVCVCRGCCRELASTSRQLGH